MSNQQHYILPKFNFLVMFLLFFASATVVGVLCVANSSRIAGPETIQKYFIVLFVIVPVVLGILLTRLMRRLYYSSVEVTLSNNQLSMQKSNGEVIFNGSIAHIHTLFYFDTPTNNTIVFKLWDKQGRTIFSTRTNIFVSKKRCDDVRRLFTDLREATNAIEGRTNPEMGFSRAPGTYYHSSLGDTLDILTATKFQQIVKKKNRKAILIGLAALAFFWAWCFYLLADSKGYYRSDNQGNIYYKGKLMEGVKAKEFINYGYFTAKDCTYVYFKGKVQPELDAKTFDEIAMRFYRDKSGVYREPRVSIFTNSKLVPVEGVDYSTFRMVGDGVYADKSSVFTFNFLSSDPLYRLAGEDAPDPHTLEMVSHSFYRDKKGVYFDKGVTLKPCPEIDAGSFEQVSWRVYKDKNNVYFLTGNIVQSGGNEKNIGYDILRGADAPSFVKITETEYEDKNTLWTISDEGEERRSATRRGRTK